MNLKMIKNTNYENFHRFKFKLIHFLCLQFPITHISMFIVLNMINLENPEIFDRAFAYFVPFIALTCCSGIYGFNLLTRTTAPHFPHLKLVQKLFCFQLVLLFTKILPVPVNLTMRYFLTSCYGPFTAIVIRHSKFSFPFESRFFVKFELLNNLLNKLMMNFYQQQ